MGTIGVHWSLDGTLVVHGCLLSTTGVLRFYRAPYVSQGDFSRVYWAHKGSKVLPCEPVGVQRGP